MTPERLDLDLLRAWALPIPHDGDKHARGTVTVVGGSAQTPGAVLLAGVAALRAGAGRLQIVTDPAAAVTVACAVPEALVAPFAAGPGGIDDDIATLIGQADAVLVGPGLLDVETADEVLGAVLAVVAPEAIVVIDAMALGHLRPDTPGIGPLRDRLVLTPNRQELEQLSGSRGDDDDEQATVAGVSESFGAAVVSFGCVAAPGGRLWTDDADVPGLGTSGSGDVLAGLAAGFAARWRDAAQAACWAELVHTRAAQRLSGRLGTLGFLARELLDEVPLVVAAATPDSPRS